MNGLVKRNPGEREFHQAVRQFTESLMPIILERPEYQKAQILERMTEPDRIIIFRVTWEDDEGCFIANRAWRVPSEVAFPCATQNEISEEDAQTLIKNGVQAVGEGANIGDFLKVAEAMLAYGAV